MSEHPTNTPNQPPDGTIAWDILWVGFLMLYVIAGYSVVPFHGDESIRVAMSVDYAYIAIEGDYDKVFYSDPPHNPVEQGYRLINGSLVHYMIGAAWHLAGFSPEDLNVPWWWEQSFQFNMDNNYYPGDDLLLVSRIPGTLMTAGAVLLMFLIGLRLQGRVTGYLASLYFGLNPAVLVDGRRAKGEGIHLFFELFVLLAGIGFLSNIHSDDKPVVPMWARAVIYGVGSGLAIAAKHTNVMVVTVVGVSILLYVLLHARRQLARVVLWLALAGVLCTGTFLLLNPAWWSNPVARAVTVTENRAEVLEGQINSFENSYRGELPRKLAGFWRQVFAGGAPMYYEAEEWGDYIAGQIVFYENTPLTGVMPPGVGVALFALMVIGYAVLLGVLKPVPLHRPAQWIMGAWGVVALVYAVFLVPMEWQRYYLPFMPMVGLTAGLGAIWVVRLYIRDAEQHAPQYRKGSARVNT